MEWRQNLLKGGFMRKKIKYLTGLKDSDLQAAMEKVQALDCFTDASFQKFYNLLLDVEEGRDYWKSETYFLKDIFHCADMIINLKTYPEREYILNNLKIVVRKFFNSRSIQFEFLKSKK
jgi:hypothetical protein